ncbi:MAG: phosphoenolpyruvate carboxylase [Deltaproteobacteria bacterium]|nr:phosphoenolpyruvate carboxylase [Deltaproteobacteria bacterium]
MVHILNRKIPATMATQHPDNAFKPYWSTKPFISTSKEVEECYRSYSDLGCQEYMWDWEGKFVDEAVVDRLYQKYYDYFSRHQLGRDKFLTFRVPNIQREGQARLARAFAGILSAAYTAHELKLHTPPLFEVIHPMTTSAQELITLQRKFNETAQFQQKILESKHLKPEHLDIIPLIEGTGTLLKSRRILEKYVDFMEKMNGKRPRMIRPFIARSDPALDGGFIAAVLSAKAALSEYFHFQKDTGIKVKPIIGAGSLRFRGGLSPQTIDEFITTYPGVATVTLQSSFRYDHPLDEVKKAVAKLNRRLGNVDPVLLTAKEMQQIARLDAIFVKYYRKTIEGLEGFINQMARFIPARRERMQHTGHFGYSRQVGKAGLNLPRAITFTAIFYSLGLPPELIGMGRGLRASRQAGLLGPLEKLYPELREAIVGVGRYFNRENLEILSRRFPLFKFVKTGVQYIESYLGEKLGPREPEDFIHRNYTSNVLQNWLRERSPEEDIVKSAQIRRSLG